MKRSSILVFWLCIAAMLSAEYGAAAQSPGQSSSQPRFATLQGIVAKDPGSEPLKKTLIELIAESQNDGGNYTAVTGVDGTFTIENIAPGRYRMFVEHTGYQQIDQHRRRSEGRVLTFSAGQEMKDLVIRVQSAAVIEGRVSDEDGDPMPDSQVAVFRQTFVSGRKHWEQAGAERTNDLGEYRIAGLAAGNYFVSVTPPPDFRSLIETTGNGNSAAPRTPADPNTRTPAAYQTTYYPGARDRGQAASIQLHPGDSYPVNFSLAPSPSLTIRGSVVNLPAGSTATIMLQSKDFNFALNGAEMHKDGTFEIRDVSPGAYTILASLDNVPVPMMARQSLQIVESVEGLRLAPQPGGSIRGRLRIESKISAHPDPSQFFLLLRSPGNDDEALGSVSMGAGFSPLAHVNADGSFGWSDVPPGHYSVQLSDASAMPDYFVRSVAVSGRDASESGFTVNGGAIAVEVVASGKGAIAEGVATNAKEEPVADAVVVAVPEARFLSHPDRYRKAVSDQSGRFALRGLAPGNYTIFAWESMDGEAYYNPEFLRSYEGQGKALRVAEEDRTSLPIKTIPEPEDQP
jgi:hypothetical protein